MIIITKEIRQILMKEVYTIQDVAKIVNKTTATVRSWEDKKITPSFKKHSDNGWKLYTRRDLEELLTCLLNHNWRRNVIKNVEDLEFIIRYCRGFVKLKDYPYKIEDKSNFIKETIVNNDNIKIISI